MGWVNGGAVAAIQALMDVITSEGTIVMPAHSGHPGHSAWSNPPVPGHWNQIIRNTLPAYDPAITPTVCMGVIPETFRKLPGVRRSAHPRLSFTAWGKHADLITGDHGLEYGLGENSPLARIYDLCGHVLLMGVGFNACTSFHLSEYRTQGSRKLRAGAPILKDGKREWVIYDEIEFYDEVFPLIGSEFEGAGKVQKGSVGSAECRLFSQREAVDFASEWLSRHKRYALPRLSMIYH